MNTAQILQDLNLRDYQQELATKILSFPTSINPLVQADTGAGKTRIISAVALQKSKVIVVAHRNILIKQISADLAQTGIYHQIIGSEHTRRQCLIEHRKTVRKDMLSPIANVYVASIDTLVSRIKRQTLNLDLLQEWTIIIDEAHHAISGNKWGKLQELFPNSQIIGFTATPCRLDKKSLHKEKGGIFDLIVQSEQLQKDSVKSLIEKGFLSDFKVYASQDPGDYSMVPTRGDDYDQIRLAAEMKGRLYQLSGDVIKHYKKYADGKQALCFCVSIDFAEEVSALFRRAGYSSASINSRMSAVDVSRIFELFRLKQIQVLTHVDMVGEGVDVPSIEALIMLRPTKSFANYRQWIGRSLRPEQNKEHAIILDHVGNVQRHGMPDQHIEWSLDSEGVQKRSNLIPCPKCDFLQNAWNTVCLECGADISKGHAMNQAYCEFIDKNLVLIKRTEIDRENRLKTEIVIPNMPGSSESLTQAVKIVRNWFIEQIKEYVSVYDLNLFLLSGEALLFGFWIDNFTLADTQTENKDKCLKVYQLWKKARDKNSK